MGRIRTIKPEFPQSESIGQLSREARLLFVQLWTIVDDAGRTRASSRMLASLLYPYDEDAGDLMEGWLIELAEKGMVNRYQAQEHSFLEICNWLKHQKIDHPSESRLPAFDESSRILASDTRSLAPDHGPVPGTSTVDQKPSRGKRGPRVKDPTKTELANARHAEFKAIIGEYWDSKNAGVQMPWDGREGKHLEMFLRAAPDITAAQFRGFLRNRFKSEVNHSERASQWIDWVASYAAGPIDRFGKTIHQEGTNGANQPSAAKQRVDNNRLAIAAALAKRGIHGPWDNPVPNGEAIPEPGHDGGAGGVHGRSGEVGPEILPPER